MHSDATEAALGLLGLSPLNAPPSHPHPHPQPQPHSHQHVAHAHGPSLTSPSVGIAIDRASAPPIFQSALPPSLVPLKRKQPSPALSTPSTTPLSPSIPRDSPSVKPCQPSHPVTTLTPPVSTKPATAPPQRHPQQRPFSPIPSTSVPPRTPPTTQHSLPSPSTSQHPLALSDAPPPDSEAISCICGYTYDDGFSIACDDCSRWCHAACFGIVQGGEVPEFWKCWLCDPTVEVDKERAVKVQKGRLKAMRTKASHATNGGAASSTAINGVSANAAVDEASGGMGKPTSRRKTSPGAERKSRRGSAVAAAIEGSGSSRKKRRPSMFSPVDPSSPSIPPSNLSSTQLHAASSRISHSNGIGPTATSALPLAPVTFPPDIYPNPSVYAQLLRVAKAWRGVTALNPPSPLLHPPPKTYSDGGYTRVDSQGYQDRYGYSMSPLDNTTPVLLDENGDVYAPRSVLRTDPPVSHANIHSGLSSQCPQPSATCTPAHLRPPSPKLYVAPDPSPLSHSAVYPSPPISNCMSTPVPSSSLPRPYVKSPLTLSTNTISSSNSNNTIPATTLLAPYTATIVPSSAYLADPLNGYAHLGMGKPQVRLVGGGWDVGLDARGVGDVPEPSTSNGRGDESSESKENSGDGKARWARCGCWPNAVVRPVICSGTKGRGGKRVTRRRHKADCTRSTPDSDLPRTMNGRSVPPPVSRMQEQWMNDSSDQDDSPLASDSDADPTTLSFALFALRDLRADEEIVLGWEWDDGHAVHMLPALMESPGMFAPAHLHHLRAQFTSILHALSSTFTTCACGSSTRDCAVRVMESVVEGRWPWPGGEMTSGDSEDDSSSADAVTGGWDDTSEVDVEGDGPDPPQSRNWGLGVNVDVDVDIEMDGDGPNHVEGRTRRVKKRRVRKKGKPEDASSSILKQKFKKAIDLGPLVGVERGFKTREKAPMNGGWGGVEIVPSSLRPFPEATTEESSHLGGNGKGKVLVADDNGRDHSSSTLPPRMRKAWPQRQAAQPKSIQETLPDHSNRAESWRAHERWRSPSDANVESPVSVSGTGEGSGVTGAVRPESLSGDGEDGVDGQETEFDTETEADGSDDTRQMPPPPMPASLDPTTVSSLTHAHVARSSSPRGSIQWDNAGVATSWVPPRTPTPTSGSSGLSSQPPTQGTATLVPPARSSAPVQFHPSPLVPTVSPSTTFSKLSLHSPDTSSAPNLSVLFSPSEPPAPVPSLCIQSDSDVRPPSPPPHRPSKPLHVHPQNESPSVSAPLPGPTVPSNSPDGTRDTPAETQYQQPYRSSPESRHETHSTLDADKKRPMNGEACRVRFASPEALCGLPQLRGRTTPPNGLEPMDTDGDSANSKVSGVVNEQKGDPFDEDAMDVDADAVGAKLNHNHNDESSSVQAHKPPPVTSEPFSPPPAIHLDVSGDVDENRDETEKMLRAEPMSVDTEPAPPVRELSPPPQPKVKMSLKDFALRKKKQREEEMAAKAIRSPSTPDGAGLPSSPNIDNSRDLPSEPTGFVNGHEWKMNGATTGDAVDPSGRTDKSTLQDNKSCAEIQTLSSPKMSTLASSTTNQTHGQHDSKSLPTFTAKLEVVDPVLPDEAISAENRMPDAVSFAPEPPPPPLTTKQTSDDTDPAMPTNALPTPTVPPIPTSTSASISMSTSTSTSATNSRSNSVGIPASSSSPNLLPHSHLSTSSLNAPPSRRPSEDGEITSSTPPKSYLPRSHTPPTQPRSFHTAHPPSPNFGPTSSSSMPVPRRPVPPLSRSPLSNAPAPAPISSSRPLPSGPRALRGSTTQATHAPPYPPSRPPYTGSQYIPRGPSADRDRIDWDRDRQWTVQARSRGRAGSNGWGR